MNMTVPHFVSVDPWDPACKAVVNTGEIASITVVDDASVYGLTSCAGPRSEKRYRIWPREKGIFALVRLRFHGPSFLVALSQTRTLKDLHNYLSQP